MKRFLLGLVVGVGVAVLVASLLPRPQSANDLLDAGFTIIDPEGFEVDRFED